MSIVFYFKILPPPFRRLIPHHIENNPIIHWISQTLWELCESVLRREVSLMERSLCPKSGTLRPIKVNISRKMPFI